MSSFMYTVRFCTYDNGVPNIEFNMCKCNQTAVNSHFLLNYKIHLLVNLKKKMLEQCQQS